MRQIVIHSVAKNGQAVSSAIDLVAGKSARIAATQNMHRFEFLDPKKSLQHGILKLKRKGSALEIDILEDGDKAANIVIENFYSGQYESQLLGMTDSDFLADYLASNGSNSSYLALTDGESMNVTLGFTPAKPFAPSAYMVAGSTADMVGAAGAASSTEAAGAGVIAANTVASWSGGSMLLPIVGGIALLGLAAGGGDSGSGGGSSGNDTPLVVGAITENANGTITVAGSAKPGATVEVKDHNGNVIASTKAGTDGAWSASSQLPVKEGALAFKGTDASGYDKVATGNYDDTRGPASMTLTPGVNTKGERTIAGTGEPGASMEVTLPNGSKVTAPVRADGTWGPLAIADNVPSGALSARQTDFNGNATNHSGIGTLPTAPNPFAITSVVENPNGTLTISGTAKPGANVALTDNDGTPIGSAQTGNDGKWTVVTAGPVEEGGITGRATDASGYDKSAGSTFDDTTGPGSITATTSFNPLGQRTISGTGEPGAVVEVTYPDNTKASATVAPNGTWGPIVVGDNVPSGNVTARQTDINGNPTNHGQVVSIPSAADPFAITSVTENPDGTLTIAGTAKPGASVALVDENNAPIGTATASGGGTWSVTTAKPVPEGSISGTATDASGYNRSTSTSYDDTSSPTTFSLNGDEDVSDKPILTGTGEPGATVNVTLPNASVLQTTVSPNGSWTISLPENTPGGTLRANQTDLNGNTSNHGEVGLLVGGVSIISNGNGTATVSGTTAPASTVTVKFPSGETISLMTPASGVFSITSTQVQAPIAGIKDISIDATKNGSVAPTVFRDFVIDANNPPAGTDNTITGNEDAIVVFYPNSFGFVDTDGHTMSGVRISTLPTKGTLFLDANDDGVFASSESVTAGQTISVNDLTFGRLKYMGAQHGNGLAYSSFQFQVIDSGPTGGNTDPTPNTMVINLNPVYDAPRLIVPGSTTIDQNTVLVLGYRVDDPDNSSTKTVEFTMSTTQGTLSATQMPGLVIAGQGTATITITGTVTQVNNSLDTGITWSGDATQSTVLQSAVRDLNPPAPPIVMDLNGDRVVSFMSITHDVTGESLTAWVAPEDGVLVWDKFGTGEILGADQWQFSLYGGNTDLEGLAALGDLNLDKVLDNADPLFDSLAVWQDANANGVADKGEVMSLAAMAIESISLVSDGVSAVPHEGVHIYGSTHATLSNGSEMLIQDAAFARVI